MLCGPHAEPVYLQYDDYARALYRTINRAANDWLDAKADQSVQVDKYPAVIISLVHLSCARVYEPD